jgi:beta-glucosidase
VKNTGSREGSEVTEVYVALPASAGEPPKRLIAWSKVHLKAGESKQVSLLINPQYLDVYDENASAWKLTPGSYTFMVGGSSEDLPLTQKVNID